MRDLDLMTDSLDLSEDPALDSLFRALAFEAQVARASFRASLLEYPGQANEDLLVNRGGS